MRRNVENIHPETWSESRQYTHKLMREFRDMMSEEYIPNVNTDRIVVLSAPPLKDGERIIERSPENVARIEYSVHLVKKIVAEKCQKPLNDVTTEEILQYGPNLVLNGETEQLPTMLEVAMELGFPKEKIEEINSGNRGISNTKTQFEEMEKDERYNLLPHMTFVTSAWHQPRVLRTGQKNFANQNFDVIGLPYKKYPFNVLKYVKGEVKKIHKYSQAGDIAT